jgi:hypothetical protein
MSETFTSCSSQISTLSLVKIATQPASVAWPTESKDVLMGILCASRAALGRRVVGRSPFEVATKTPSVQERTWIPLGVGVSLSRG